MIYAYDCPSCHAQFDVVKSHRDMERNENCPKCGEFAVRQFVPEHVHFTKTAVEHPEYNPGLGMIVKNAKHRRDEARARGLEEIGNEAPDKIHRHFDEARQEKLENAYDDADRGWVGNGDIGA